MSNRKKKKKLKYEILSKSQKPTNKSPNTRHEKPSFELMVRAP